MRRREQDRLREIDQRRLAREKRRQEDVIREEKKRQAAEKKRRQDEKNQGKAEQLCGEKRRKQEEKFQGKEPESDSQLKTVVLSDLKMKDFRLLLCSKRHLPIDRLAIAILATCYGSS
jgi:carbamoylphosphate synthase small subunit